MYKYIDNKIIMPSYVEMEAKKKPFDHMGRI